MSKEIVTFKDVQERIHGKTLEQLTSQEIFERYIVYGTKDEINTPSIQKALIKHRLYDDITRNGRHNNRQTSH